MRGGAQSYFARNRQVEDEDTTARAQRLPRGADRATAAPCQAVGSGGWGHRAVERKSQDQVGVKHKDSILL